MSQPNRFHLWRHCRAPIYSAGCVSWGCDSSYPGEGERTTFESSLKKGWIKHNSFWQTCLLWYAEEVSGVSVWGKSWRWWLWGCIWGCENSLFLLSLRPWERRGFLLTKKTSKRALSGVGVFLHDYEDSQLLPHFCDLLQDCKAQWGPSEEEVCLLWWQGPSVFTVSPFVTGTASLPRNLHWLLALALLSFLARLYSSV